MKRPPPGTVAHHMLAMEARRRAGVHRWDYEYPSNVWETLPFWLRWPMGIGAAAMILGPMLAVAIELVSR